MEGGEGFRVRHNRLVRNGAGITLGPGSRNVITRNRVFGGGDGIRIEKGHGNLVAHNVVVHTRRAGIRLGIKHPFSAAPTTSSAETWSGTAARWVPGQKKDRHSLLKRNVATGSGDDGFDIESRSAKLTSNRARAKRRPRHRRGPRGDRRWREHRAHGNGDPRQCMNIVCN